MSLFGGANKKSSGSLVGSARFQKQNTNAFRKNLKDFSGDQRRQIMSALKDDFSGGKKISKDRILKTVGTTLGYSTKKKVEEAMVPKDTESEAERLKKIKMNLNYARSIRIGEEMEIEGKVSGRKILRSALGTGGTSKSGMHEQGGFALHAQKISGYGGQRPEGGSASVVDSQAGGSASIASVKSKDKKEEDPLAHRSKPTGLVV